MKPDLRVRSYLKVLRSLRIGLLLFYFPLILTGRGKDKIVRLEDHSDWWSILNESFKSPKVKAQDTDLAPQNFELLGLSLNSSQFFQSVQNKLGHAAIVERGDASTGRHQVCYLSEQNPDTRLIFEQGELNLVFYIIAGGDKWNGDTFCTKSRAINAELSTASGLHLGMTRADLEQVLGKPDLSVNEKLFYFRKLRKQTSPTELAKLRTEHSGMSEKDFHETYDSYYLAIYIEARLVSSKLTYLAVSRAESD
jgi:hypothetical protein